MTEFYQEFLSESLTNYQVPQGIGYFQASTSSEDSRSITIVSHS